MLHTTGTLAGREREREVEKKGRRVKRNIERELETHNLACVCMHIYTRREMTLGEQAGNQASKLQRGRQERQSEQQS